MRKFEITIDHLQSLLNIFGEVQAKIILPAIDIIRNLPEIVENTHPESDKPKNKKDNV